MLERARPASVLGLTVRVLAPTDTLFHTCLHLSYGHGYQRYPLRTLADVLVLAASGEIDWPDFVARVRLARASGAVYWPLWLAQIWLGAPIPRAVLAMLAPPKLLRRSVGAVMQSGYILDRTSVPDDGSRVLFDLLLHLSLYSGCSIGRRLRALVDGVFPRPEGVTHLTDEVRGSPIQYAREMAGAGRLWRGVTALWRLHRPSNHSPAHGHSIIRAIQAVSARRAGSSSEVDRAPLLPTKPVSWKDAPSVESGQDPTQASADRAP